MLHQTFHTSLGITRPKIFKKINHYFFHSFEKSTLRLKIHSTYQMLILAQESLSFVLLASTKHIFSIAHK